MNVKNFLAQPKNLWNLGLILFVTAQAIRLVGALGKGGELLIGIQLSLLVSMIIVFSVQTLYLRRLQYLIKLEGAQIVFLCGVLAVFFQFL